MLDITEDTVRALFAQTIEPVAILVTINATGPDGPIDAIRATDSANPLNGGPLKGLTSRGTDYRFYPFGLQWGGSGNGEITRDAQITIGNVAGEISDALEAVIDQPVMTIEVVRVSAPDVVERALSNATLISTEEDGPSIKGMIRARRFDTEPACGKSYLPATTPSLF